MKKNIKILSFLFLTFILLATSTLSSQSSAFTIDDKAYLVLDSLNEGLPRNFRKSSSEIYPVKDENINFDGLNKLNISGSQQFSENNLSLMLEYLNTSYPITVVDLRQESHGFINGLPVSWRNIDNNANEGLSKEQVILKETKQLKSIPLNVPITLYDNPNDTVIPTKVINEDSLVTSKKLSYIRIPVTDGGIPNDDMVNYFLQVFKNYPKDSWIHFHCKEGFGRTTIFMIMYDMIKNFDKASATNIMDRQLILSNFDNATIREFYNPERYKFLLNFYNYCKESSNNPNLKWSDWKNQTPNFISISVDNF